jgi:hypothetical protein
MTIRAAIYGRVSTTSHGQDMGLQTRELRQFAEARGWTVAGEYIDAGVSGAKDSRPELNRLMADAHKRRFRVQLNSFDVPCGPSQEGPDSPSYPDHYDTHNQKCFPSLAHLLP